MKVLKRANEVKAAKVDHRGIYFDILDDGFDAFFNQKLDPATTKKDPKEWKEQIEVHFGSTDAPIFVNKSFIKDRDTFHIYSDDEWMKEEQKILTEIASAATKFEKEMEKILNKHGFKRK